MNQVAAAILLIFSGFTITSAQPLFGGPGFGGFPGGPFGGDIGPRPFGFGGDFGPPTIRRLGGRFPEFGGEFGGGIRGGGPLLGGVDGQRFGFNGDNGITGPRFDGLRRGRFGFDDTTLGTGFGRQIGGGQGTRFIPGERLGVGAFGAGNAIAPRRIGTTRTITRGNALDVPRSTVLGGLGTDTTGLFTDPITGRGVRVLSNNDASTVVSRRTTGGTRGTTRTGTITTRRVDPAITATRTRLPTTLTQRGTLLRRQIAGGRRTPITRLGGTTVTRPGTLAGTAGTGLTFLNNIRGGRGAFPRPFLPFDNIEGRPMIPLNALDGAEALIDPRRSFLGAQDGLPLSDFERLNNLARDINMIASRQLRTIQASVMTSNMSPTNPLSRNLAMTSPLVNRQGPMTSPLVNRQSPMANPLVSRQNAVAPVPIFNNFVQQQSLRTISSPLSSSIDAQGTNPSPMLVQVPRQQVQPTPSASSSPSPSMPSQASRNMVRRHTSTTQRPLYQQLNWIKLHQYMSRVIQFQQNQQQKALQEHAKRQLKEQSAKDEELMKRIKHLTDHIKRLEKQQHEHLEVIRQQEEIKLQQKQSHERQQREWQIMLQNLIDTLQSPQHKYRNGSFVNTQAPVIPTRISTVQGGVPIFQHETAPTGGLSSLFDEGTKMPTSVMSTQVGTISNSANVDVSASAPSSDGVPVSGFVSEQSQGAPMVEENLEKLLLTYLNNIEYNTSSQVAALLAPSLLGINSTKGANMDLLLPMNDTVVTPSTIHNITSPPLSTTLSGDSVVVEGKSFIDWSMFNKVLQEEGLLPSNDTSVTSSHPDIIAARATLQDLVDGKTSFLQFNQTVVGLGNNAQQGALRSFSRSQVPQGMSMTTGTGMDQQMRGMSSRTGIDGTHMSNTGARTPSGVPSVNSNRLTFDSVDLSAFGGQTGFGADPTSQLTG